MFFPLRRRFQPLKDEERSSESRRYSVFRWTEAEPKALHQNIFIFHDRMTHKIRQRMNRCDPVVEFTLEPPLRRRKRRTPGRFFLAKGEFPKPTNQEVQNGKKHQ